MNLKYIIPTLRYVKAFEALDWLCDTFGFEKHLVVPGDDGLLRHAQLRAGHCMVMVGSAQNKNQYGKLVKQPKDIGQFQTQSPYLVVPDNEMQPLYEKVQHNGGQIAMELRQEDHGGQFFACYDPEGHLWNFGSYDPFRDV